MRHKDQVMVTAIYHPKPGYEDEFIKAWNQKLCKLAYDNGATEIGIYHNEETEEFFSIATWPTRDLVEKFLSTEELLNATREINRFCLVPVTRELFEILREAAA